MYGNELRLTAMERDTGKAFLKSFEAKKARLEAGLNELTDELIDDIDPRVKDWLDGHGAESSTSWADMVLDSEGMSGAPLLG